MLTVYGIPRKSIVPAAYDGGVGSTDDKGRDDLLTD
jgi:hypothetical protein